MHSVSFVFCLHDHQPEGNFDSVFRSATDASYRPFLELLAGHPSVRVSMHISGILFAWIEKHDPAAFALLEMLTGRGQIELLGGGFHEPILPSIPDADKHGQIRKLSSFITDRFHVPVRGMWLAERVWEQHLVRPIRDAGIEFTVLDDTHIQYAGIPEERLNGYFVTEEEGRTIAVFPISKTLRYLIPFGAVEETLEHLYTLGTRAPGAIAVYADDGEKFGVWPKTHEHVWGHGWLRHFFDALEQNADWLHTRHFADVLDTVPAAGRIYLPNASYAEMMHWALPDPGSWRRYAEFERVLKLRGEESTYRPFVRGGFWRNFLVKYPEVNTMHKKMLRVSRRVHANENPVIRQSDIQTLGQSDGPIVRPSDDSLLTTARDFLWAGQCNCPYWHGVFGGLYLPHIRHEVFTNLIRAEQTLDVLEGCDRTLVTVTDFDADGRDEVLVETPEFNAYFQPASGAQMFELDFKASAYNLLDTLTRREEGYHAQVRDAVVAGTGHADETKSIHDLVHAKEAGLAEHLVYDWYRKGAFIDHVFGDDVTAEEFARASYREEGDFVDQPWLPEIIEDGARTIVRFTRDGARWRDGSAAPLRIVKTFTFERGSSDFGVVYELHSMGAQELDIRFGVEYNANMLSGSAPDRYIEFGGVAAERVLAGARGRVHGCSGFAITNEWDDVRTGLSFDLPAEVWHAPIETVSLSEDGFERTYQGTSMVAVWHLRLLHSASITMHHTLSTVR